MSGQGFVGAWKSLELANRVARLTSLMHQKLHSGDWVRNLPNADPDVFPELNNASAGAGTDWIVDRLENLEDEKRYREVQARLVGLCLRAAIVDLNYQFGLLRQGIDKDAALLEASKEKSVDLSVLLPSIDDGDFDSKVRVRHFGSIAFHKAGTEVEETLWKENFGDFHGLWPESEPKSHRVLAEWLTELLESKGLEDPYAKRLEQLSKEKPRLRKMLKDRSIFKSENKRLFFQQVVSPILHRRQGMFLAAVGAQVPLILLGTEPSAPKAQGAKALYDSYPGNLLKLGSKVTEDVQAYIHSYPRCGKCLSAGLGQKCFLPRESRERLHQLRRGLLDFVEDLSWRNLKGKEEWKEMLTDQERCSHLAEFQLPFAFFGQPVLISCARLVVSDVTSEEYRVAERGPVSLSLAVTPARASPVNNSSDLGRWSSVAAGGLHQLVTDVDAAITEIDQAVSRRRILRHSLRSSVAGVLARSMAHDLGSHLLVELKLPEENPGMHFDPEKTLSSFKQLLKEWNKSALPLKDARREFDSVSQSLKRSFGLLSKAFQRNNMLFTRFKDYLRQRMVFVAEASTNEPRWLMSLPLKHVLRTIADPLVDDELASRSILEFLTASELRAGDSAETTAGEVGLPTRVRLRPLDSVPEISIGFPAGIVGAHALFAILENVARNAAKNAHSAELKGLERGASSEPGRPDLATSVLEKGHPRRRGGGLEIRYTVENEPDSDHVTLRIWDMWSGGDLTWNRVKSYFPPNSGSLLAPDLAANRSGPRGGWGMREMRVAAAWLLGAQVGSFLGPLEREELDTLARPGDASVLETGGQLRPCKVRPDDGCIAGKEEEEWRLGYELRLLKPTHTILVTNHLQPDKTLEDLTITYLQDPLEWDSEDGDRLLSRLARFQQLILDVRGRSDVKTSLNWLLEHRTQLPMIAVVVGAEEGCHLEDSRVVVLPEIASPQSDEEADGTDVAASEQLSGDFICQVVEARRQWLKKFMGMVIVPNLEIRDHLDGQSDSSLMEDWYGFAQLLQGIGPGCGHYDLRVVQLPNSDRVLDENHTAVVTDHDRRRQDNQTIVDLLRRASPTRYQLRSISGGSSFSLLHHSLSLREGCIKIAIIDERLLPEAGRWEHMGLIFPNHEHLYGDVSSPLRETGLTEAIGQAYESGARILIIHHGLLEKVEGSLERATKWAERVFKSFEVVICSDRAENSLSTLPVKNVRFMPFSLLDYCLKTIESKDLLVKAVFNCKRTVLS